MIRLQWWTVELLSTRSQHDSYDYPLTRSRSQAGVAVPADFYVHQPWTRVKGRFLTCDRRCSGRSDWPVLVKLRRSSMTEGVGSRQIPQNLSRDGPVSPRRRNRRRCGVAPHRPLVRTAPTLPVERMMQPTLALVGPTSPTPTEHMDADDLLGLVEEEDKQWANTPQRRVLICWFLKKWYPVDFSPESAYDTLTSLGGFGKDGLLQKVVHESLLHPMTGVSYKPTDCALVLNRPCLRYKNINFKLAGFVRVDGSRYLKADAVERYQENVTWPGLLDEVLEAASLGPDWRLFGPAMQRKGSFAFMDVAKMRACPPAPPRPRPRPFPGIAHRPTRARRTHSATWPNPSTSCSRTMCTGTSRWWETRCAEPRQRPQPPESRPTGLSPSVLRRPCTAATSRRTCGRRETC